MKKFSILIITASFALAAGLFNSCSKEESSPITNNQSKNLKAAIAYVGCETQCIEQSSGDYYYKTDQQVVTWGGRFGNANSKTVDIEYYNTETEFVLKVRSTSGWSDLVINGASAWTHGPVAANVWGTYSVALTEGWQACDLINWSLQVTGNGNPAYFTVNYNLIGLCGCDEDFNYVNNNDGTYTFTYIPEETMTGALVEFTIPQGVIVTGLTGFVQPGNGNGQVYQQTMELNACEEYTWTLTFQPYCNGNQPNSNVWTDFKVGGVSKKDIRGLQNIILPCGDN